MYPGPEQPRGSSDAEAPLPEEAPKEALDQPLHVDDDDAGASEASMSASSSPGSSVEDEFSGESRTELGVLRSGGATVDSPGQTLQAESLNALGDSRQDRQTAGEAGG